MVRAQQLRLQVNDQRVRSSSPDIGKVLLLGILKIPLTLFQEHQTTSDPGL